MLSYYAWHAPPIALLIDDDTIDRVHLRRAQHDPAAVSGRWIEYITEGMTLFASVVPTCVRLSSLDADCKSSTSILDDEQGDIVIFMRHTLRTEGSDDWPTSLIPAPPIRDSRR